MLLPRRTTLLPLQSPLLKGYQNKGHAKRNLTQRLAFQAQTTHSLRLGQRREIPHPRCDLQISFCTVQYYEDFLRKFLYPLL